MSTLAKRAAPFTHTVNTVTRTMVWVILALVPGTAYGLWLYGWPALMLFAINPGQCIGCGGSHAGTSETTCTYPPF
jgi:electron transport complex protein RnfD